MATPPVHPLESPHAQRIPAAQAAAQSPAGIDPLQRDRSDPAWQPPVDATRGDIRSRARVISREIPLVTISTNWSVAEVRAALQNLVIGLFDSPTQLWESIIGEARIQATLGARTSALFGQPVRHTMSKVPGVDEVAATECLAAWREVWPRLATEASLNQIHATSIGLGFGVGQLLWDTQRPIWVPYLSPWNTRYSYFHWTLRKLIAQGLDGQEVVEPGDGHWFLLAPHGEYRGWMHGAIRALAEPWLIRAFAYRDMARCSERHGMPMIVAKRPAAGDPVLAEAWRVALSTLGQETVLDAPQGVDEQNSYDVDLLEATADNWRLFAELIDRCEMSETLAIMHQNLTTEVQEGSLAAARTHAGVKQEAIEADERAVSLAVYQQIARPFAALNWGNPDLAPETHWDLAPQEDQESKARTLGLFAKALADLRTAGYVVGDVTALAKRIGMRVESADIQAAPEPAAPEPGK